MDVKDIFLCVTISSFLACALGNAAAVLEATIVVAA